MNSYPNSDCKPCTESKLGWVHSAHTQNPGRAHTAHVVPMSWALLRAQQACRAHSQRRSRACWGCTCRDTPRQPAPRSRPHFDVATSRQPESCRDTTQNAPGRDLKTGSRHQTSCRQSTQVATSISCRDFTLTGPGRDLKSCRDLKLFSPGHNMNFMSRPRPLQS